MAHPKEPAEGNEAWDIVAKRMRVASTIAANCNTYTAMVYDRLVLEEMRQNADSRAEWTRKTLERIAAGGAL